MTRSTALHRRLADGLYGRMEFDFACNRGHGFGEAHLHGALMEILASNSVVSQSRIEPSHLVAAIQRRIEDGAEVSRGGRKREVDFAVFHQQAGSNARELAYCTEAKWAGSSHASALNILRDLARLALVHQEHPEATCLFLLAGGKNDVAKKLDAVFALVVGRPRHGAYVLDRRGTGRPGRLDLLLPPTRRTDPLQSTARAMLDKTFDRLSTKYWTELSKPGHNNPPNWRVHSWRVTAPLLPVQS